MNRGIYMWSALCLGVLALGAPSRADDSSRMIFDGSGKAEFQVARIIIPGVKPRPIPSNGAPRDRTAEARLTRQSGADLYYFTREEARAAAKLFGVRKRPLAPRKFTFDSDVPADLQAQLLADMAFIEGLGGTEATPLHLKIFGPLNGADYLRFFEGHVTAIGMDTCGSAKAVACVIPLFNPSKMWLTPNFVKFSHPQIARMMIVFHEARHTETENDNWPHATCPTPFLDADGREINSIWTGASLAGEPACDETPMGSYGSSTIMLKNIQKFCANCTDKVRMDAGLYADDQFRRIIDPGARKQMEDDLYK